MMREAWEAIKARFREQQEERDMTNAQLEERDVELVRKDEVIDTLRRSRERDEYEIRQMKAIGRAHGGRRDE